MSDLTQLPDLKTKEGRLEMTHWVSYLRFSNYHSHADLLQHLLDEIDRLYASPTFIEGPYR